MKRLLLTALASLASQGCASAETMDISHCFAPPAAEDTRRLLEFYPAEAKAAGKEGSATLLCGRSEHARLVNCSLKAEEPVGLGFGEAALKLAQATQDNPNVNQRGPLLVAQPITFRFTLSEPYVRPNVFSETWGQPTIIQLPDWLERLTAAQAAAAYPRHVLGGNPPGRVLLKCLVDLDGSSACSVLEESPAERGFGVAALKLSKRFKFKPMLVDGRPCDRGEIKVPIAFSPPG